MADLTDNSEKIHEEKVEVRPGEDVSMPSNPEEGLTARQGDDIPDKVSLSTFMAIFVSSMLIAYQNSIHSLRSPFSSLWACRTSQPYLVALYLSQGFSNKSALPLAIPKILSGFRAAGRWHQLYRFLLQVALAISSVGDMY